MKLRVLALAAWVFFGSVALAQSVQPTTSGQPVTYLDFVAAEANARMSESAPSTEATEEGPAGTPTTEESTEADSGGQVPSTAPAKAGTTRPPWADKPWEVKFKVYAWVPGMDGRVSVGRAVTHLNIDYCDVLEVLDKIECYVPFDLEARVGHWGFDVDMFHVRLEDTAHTPLGPVHLLAEQTILELAGFYRIGTWPACPRSDSSISLDMFGGARYNRLNGGVGLPMVGQGIQLSRTEEWWDPFVGPRVTWRPMNKLSIFARSDIGGFGIENCSHSSWQFIGGAEYDFTKNVFLEVGYRLLDTDFDTGSGRNHFEYDILMQGPYLALGVKF